MKRLQLIAVAIMLGMSLTALGQTQKGYVKTLGRPNQKGMALSGVTIRVSGVHNAVLSGNDGTFSMSMTGKKNGEPYALQQVQKSGYELNDNTTIGRQYAFSIKVPLTIVMVSKQQLQDDKLRIENTAYKKAEKKYRQMSALLEKQKEQNEITEENYREQLRALQNSFSKYQSLIDDLAEHYAHTDYDELDAKEYEINQCIENGELERADSILQQMGIYQRINYITKRLESGTSLRETAQKEMAAVLKQQEKDAEYLYQLYTISLGRFDNDKAKFYIETRAELDSTNVEWQLDAGQFNSEFLANYDAAQEYFARGLRNTLSQFGEQSELSAKTYCYIGNFIYFEKKEIQSALDYIQKAFEIRKALYDETHPLVAMSYGGMGSVLSVKGDFPKAMEYQEKALEIRKQVLPYMHNDMAMSYYNIGYIEACTGKFKEGLEDMQKALDILKGLYGEQSIHVADSYHNIGYIYYMIGDYGKGEEYLNKGYAIRKNLFGENHPDVAESLNGLGNINLTKGNYEKAADYFLLALTIRMNIFGEKNSMVATSYNNIATTFSSMGNLEKALEYYNESLAIGQSELGARHIEVGVTYLNIANTYWQMKDYVKAIENVNTAMDIFKSSLGDNDIKVAHCYNQLGVIYSDMGQYDKAIENHEKALKIRQSVLGENHFDISVSYNNIGYSYYQQDQYLKAIDYFTTALHGFIVTVGKNHPQVKNTKESIDSAYQAYLGNHPKDERIQQAYKEFKNTYMKGQ